jgi:type I restriction enzyme M protein
VKANKYDLSAGRYRQIEQDQGFYDQPQTTLERLQRLGQVSASKINALQEILKV